MLGSRVKVAEILGLGSSVAIAAAELRWHESSSCLSLECLATDDVFVPAIASIGCDMQGPRLGRAAGHLNLVIPCAFITF